MAGISPKASVFGNLTGQGIVVVEAAELNMPGALIFATVDNAGAKTYNMIWCDTSGNLRIVSATTIYDPAGQVVDFSAFNQDSAGVKVGGQ